MSIFKRGDREAIVSWPYQQILSFGAPVINTYKLILDDNSSVTFETTKVLEIAKLMKANINELVRASRAGAGGTPRR